MLGCFASKSLTSLTKLARLYSSVAAGMPLTVIVTGPSAASVLSEVSAHAVRNSDAVIVAARATRRCFMCLSLHERAAGPRGCGFTLTTCEGRAVVTGAWRRE